MTTAQTVGVVLLWAGVAAELLCVLGLVWMRDAFDGLHFVGAATTIGPVLVGVAVLLTGFSSPSGTIGCGIACLVLFLLNPVLTSATGRAGRQLTGSLTPTDDEWERQK